MAASPTLDVAPALARETSAAAAEEASLLYERYYDRVYGYCLYQLGSRDEAEDAAQTTFLWAFRGLRRGVVPRAEASWLFTIAQNACRARHRARGRRSAREVVSDPHVLQDLTAAPAAEHDELAGLEDALARMPELQRRAILLREWRGLSYREIATELELSGAAVETLIFRARRSLAGLLAGRPAPKRARGIAFEGGSVAAAVKAFGAGTAVKIAAGVAVAVLAVTIAGSTAGPTQTTPARAPRVTEPFSLVRGTPPTPTKTPRHDKADRAKTGKPKPAADAPGSAHTVARDDESGLGQTVEDATESLPVVSDVVQTLPLEPATYAVDPTVDTATDILPPTVADALP